MYFQEQLQKERKGKIEEYLKEDERAKSRKVEEMWYGRDGKVSASQQVEVETSIIEDADDDYI